MYGSWCDTIVIHGMRWRSLSVGAILGEDGHGDAFFVGAVLVALHGEGLARACLAVGEDGRVVAIDHGLDEVADAGTVVETALRSCLVQDEIKLRGLVGRCAVVEYTIGINMGGLQYLMVFES